MNLNNFNPSRRRSEGSAVMVVVAILALVLMFSTANRITLKVLAGEIELIDQRQQRRIAPPEPATPTTLPTPGPQAETEESHGSD
jgi:hypothetical protein